MIKYYGKEITVSLRRVLESDCKYSDILAKEIGRSEDDLWNLIYYSHRTHFVNVIELNDKENTVVGFCRADNMRSPFPTIAIYLYPEYRRMGYGYESIRLFMDVIKRRKNTKVEYFSWTCTGDNEAAMALAAKLEADLFRVDTLEGPRALHKLKIEMGLEKEEDVKYVYIYNIMK